MIHVRENMWAAGVREREGESGGMIVEHFFFSRRFVPFSRMSFILQWMNIASASLVHSSLSMILTIHSIHLALDWWEEEWWMWMERSTHTKKNHSIHTQFELPLHSSSNVAGSFAWSALFFTYIVEQYEIYLDKNRKSIPLLPPSLALSHSHTFPRSGVYTFFSAIRSWEFEFLNGLDMRSLNVTYPTRSVCEYVRAESGQCQGKKCQFLSMKMGKNWQNENGKWKKIMNIREC